MFLEWLVLAYILIVTGALSYFWIFELSSADYADIQTAKARRAYMFMWHIGSFLWFFVLVWYLGYMIWRDNP